MIQHSIFYNKFYIFIIIIIMILLSNSRIHFEYSQSYHHHHHHHHHHLILVIWILLLLNIISSIILTTTTSIVVINAFTIPTLIDPLLSISTTSTTTTTHNMMIKTNEFKKVSLLLQWNIRKKTALPRYHYSSSFHVMGTTIETSSRSTCSSTSKMYMSTETSTTSTESSVSVSSSLLALRLQGLDAPTVWQEFSPLATQYKAINLGQGFPDWEPPTFVIDSMISSILPSSSSFLVANNDIVGRGANQYARSYAHMPLANALADIYTRRWKDTMMNNDIDPNTQIATATGCTNVLYCTIQGLINPGDEVILFEPAFDIYSSQVKLAGGIPIYIPLRPNIVDLTTQSASDVFTFDMDELESLITEKTKLILINTPHNPTGKMFTKQELHGIANIVQKHPKITVISDEVYEHIIFDPINEPHISIATIIPQQTLTLSSAGKTFSATGWKVGWAIGPKHLIKAVTAVQQWVNFSAATPNQDAIAYSLLQAEEPYIDPNTNISYDTYYTYLASEYLRKRTLLINALQVAGMTPIVPPGGFFIMADTSHITFPYHEKYESMITDAMPTRPMPRDWALSRWLTEEVGVTAIPPSAFYCIPNIPLAQNMLRFAFCKSDATIQEAHVRFEQYFQK